MGKLAGQVGIVTGASRGIGAAAAEALAREGAALMLVARDAAQVEAVARRIADAGGQAAAMACNVADWPAVQRLVAETRERFGRLDILVNNAGVIEPIAPLAGGDPAAWARNIEINLVGAYYGIRAALPEMTKAGRGTIVNVSSGAAHRALEGWSAYCAGKAGLAMLTEALALEYREKGIRVFGLSPGTVDTEMQVKIRASGINPVSQIPRGQLAPVDAPARAIAYLCEPAADDLIGSEVSLRDGDFRRRIGLD